MGIQHNPLDQDGITRKGKRWQLLPIIVPTITVAYLDLRYRTGANKRPNLGKP